MAQQPPDLVTGLTALAVYGVFIVANDKIVSNREFYQDELRRNPNASPSWIMFVSSLGYMSMILGLVVLAVKVMRIVIASELFLSSPQDEQVLLRYGFLAMSLSLMIPDSFFVRYMFEYFLRDGRRADIATGIFIVLGFGLFYGGMMSESTKLEVVVVMLIFLLTFSVFLIGKYRGSR